MNLVWIFFVLVVMGGCALGALVTAALVWYCTRRRPRALRAGLLLLTPVPFYLLMSRCLGPYEPTDPKALASAFETEFLVPPPTDVTNIQVSQSMVADWVGAWMRFEASPGTVDILLKRFTPCERLEFDDADRGPHVPSWWRPDTDGVVSFYKASPWSDQFFRSTAVMAHDAAKHVVYFYHDGSN